MIKSIQFKVELPELKPGNLLFAPATLELQIIGNVETIIEFQAVIAKAIEKETDRNDYL
jgi:hypothetical protein